MSKVEYVKFNSPSLKKQSAVPVVTKWHNAPMIRVHSISAACREILNISDSSDVVKINIIGTPSTGKTSLAKTVQHLCHKLSDIPYTVKTFSRQDLLDFEYTLSKLQPTNHILLFDDVSFLRASAGARKVAMIEKAFTEIRHLQGGQDVKIIAIFNFHYNMAVSKYLRQSDFFFYTSIGSSELENTQKIVGVKYTRKMLEYRRVLQEAVTTKKFTFKLGTKGGEFTYPYRKPFAPVLFWNNDTLRIVVYPLRTWIDPVCPDCLHSETRASENMDIKKFDEDIRTRFGIGILRHALKIKLFNMGVNTFPKRVKQCMSYVDDYMKKNYSNLEELADFYNLKDNRTRLDFKVGEPETKPPEESNV